ncbi:MAG: efflux transporter outer membrane subunit [Candidatus Rokuibacteriota bacterium]
MTRTTNVPALVYLLVVIAGCAVGPDYRRPEMGTPAAFRGEAGPPEAPSFADLPWWEVFRDPVLKGLIQDALAGNYDLRIAVARVGQARALAGVARADFFPWIDYNAGVQRNRGVFKFVPEFELPAGGTDNLFIGGLSATWEIDVWGRIRRANEAARAELLATEEARRGVLLSLVSDVAQAYFTLLALDLRLSIAHSATDSFQRTYTLFRRRFEAGVASTLQTSRAEGALASTAATIPDLERQIAMRENQINVLLGRDPGPVPRGVLLVEQQMPPVVPPGLPSVLLERRPDVREAEQRLVKANAQIGVAKAAFFPRIGLTALLGAVSPELSALTSGTASLWALAGSLTGPIFQGGRIREGYRASLAAWEQANLAYEVTAIRAFQEVSDALVSLQKLAQFEAEQARSVTALEQSVRVANRRYFGGLASYYEVLEAQQLLFPAQDTLARIRRDRFLALVGLYKALGGGWNLTDSQWRADAR